MMRVKKSLFIILIIIIILVSYLIFRDNISKYIDFNKETYNLNYTYNIDSELNVIGIIDKNNIIIQEKNNLIEYNLNEEKKERIVVEISEGYKVNSVNTNDTGVIWVETRDTPSIESKIYFKYFDSDQVILIDETNDKILPDISLKKDNISYYIVNDNKFEVKLMNIKSFEKKVLKAYESSNDKVYISPSSINSTSIVWSFVNNQNSIISIYDIDSGEIKEIVSDDIIYNPVLKGSRLFAIKENIYYDDEIKDSYLSNYIVELDRQNEQWIKFENENINKYISEPRESIFKLPNNSDLLYWSSSISDGNCIYDSSNNKFIMLTKYDSKFNTQIILAKEKNIYYEAIDNEGKINKFILNLE